MWTSLLGRCSTSCCAWRPSNGRLAERLFDNQPQRKVDYDNLVAACLPELRARTGRRGQTLLEYLDRFMAEHDVDANPGALGDGGSRAVLGIYYREETNGAPR